MQIRVKMLKGILPIMLLLSVAALACGCSFLNEAFEGNPTEGTKPNPKPAEKVVFFSTDAIVYNEDYVGETSDEKGFLLYDAIDFTDLVFDESKIDEKSAQFVRLTKGEDVYYDDAIGERSFYVFKEEGEYTVTVSARKSIGGTYTDSFQVKVATGGRPTDIDFYIADKDGVTTTAPQAGQTLTLHANVYSKDTLLTDLADYTFQWSGGEDNRLDYSVDCPNALYAKEQRNYFSLALPTLNGIEKYSLGKQFIYTVEDSILRTEERPEGVSFTMPDCFTDGKAVLSPLESPYADLSGTIHFIDGSTQEVASSTTTNGARLSMYVKYDTNTYYSVHGGGFYYKYENGQRVMNYYDNDMRFYFDTDAESASVYFALIVVDGSEQGYDSRRITGSDGQIEFVSAVTEGLRVTEVSGYRRKVTAFTSPTEYTAYASAGGTKGRESFATDVVADSVDVYVCCDMDRDGDIENEYTYKTANFAPQDFSLSVAVDSGAMDYYVTVINPTGKRVLRHYTYYKKYAAVGDGEPYEIMYRNFVALEEGTATIQLTPRTGGEPYLLTVNVINPVVKTKLSLDYTDNLYTRLDMSKTARVCEYRYNFNKAYGADFGYSERKLSEEESLRYRYDGLYREADYFTFSNCPANGFDITAKLIQNGEETASADKEDCFFIPNFTFSLAGGEPIEAFSYTNTLRVSGQESAEGAGKSRYFSADVPYFQLTGDLSQLTSDSLVLSGTGAGDNLTSNVNVLTDGSYSYTVEYAYSYYGYKYRLTVAEIIVTRQETE